MRWTGAWLAVLLALPALADSRRIAIVVGNNAGSAELQPLRYAENDAGKFARVLVELGDVLPDDVMLLQGRKVADLERAIADARERVVAFKRNPDMRTVLMFFFSGHSDGESIEMGHEKLPYARLKAMLSGTGADVRLAIVDACKSGAGFQEKGGKSADPFVIKLTDTLVATGDAFITSSAADESALESSEVMGSFFTHNLISGLRGAADVSGDKLVTLAEAYRYAYDRTVSATSVLAAGAQHPSYDYRLSGQGELVLSSLLKSSATLLLPDGAERSVVTDLVRDQVVVELTGTGPARELALAPGQYGVRIIKGGKSYGTRVTLAEGSKRLVGWAELTPMSSSMAVAAKGGEVTASAPPPSVPADPRVLAVTLGFGRGIAPEVHYAGYLRANFEPWTGWGPTLSLLGSLSVGSLPSEFTVQMRAGYRLSWAVSRLWFGLGAELGPVVVWQDFSTTTMAVDVSAGVAFTFAARGTARVKLGGPVSLMLDGEMGVLLLRLDNKTQALPMPQLTLGVAFDL